MWCVLLFVLAAAAPAGDGVAVPRPNAVSPAAPALAPNMRGRPFLSPMGEPFRAEAPGGDALDIWFVQADRNADAALGAAELLQDAVRFFATLDVDHDGEIDPDEMTRYERDVAPEIQVGPRPRLASGPDMADESMLERRRLRDMVDNGLIGAGRFGLLNIPQPVASADADLNRGVSRVEFERAATKRFGLLDTDRDGRLTLLELKAIRDANAPPAPKRRKGGKGAQEAIASQPVA